MLFQGMLPFTVRPIHSKGRKCGGTRISLGKLNVNGVVSDGGHMMNNLGPSWQYIPGPGPQWTKAYGPCVSPVPNNRLHLCPAKTHTIPSPKSKKGVTTHKMGVGPTQTTQTKVGPITTRGNLNKVGGNRGGPNSNTCRDYQMDLCRRYKCKYPQICVWCNGPHPGDQCPNKN